MKNNQAKITTRKEWKRKETHMFYVGFTGSLLALVYSAFLLRG